MQEVGHGNASGWRCGQRGFERLKVLGDFVEER